MLTRFILLFGVLLIGSAHVSTRDHAIYLSAATLQIDNESYLEVKVFSDDLYSVLRGESDFKSGLKNFVENNRSIIEDYFNKKVMLDINDKSTHLNYASYSEEGDAHFIRFDLDHETPVKKIKAQATYFIEVFPAQTNVLTIKNGDSQSFMKFDKGTEAQSITFSSD